MSAQAFASLILDMNSRALFLTLCIAAPLLVFAWLLDKEFAPRGIWEVRTGFEKSSQVIRTPDDAGFFREDGRRSLSVPGSSASFEIENTHTFLNARLVALWRTTADVVEMGVLARKDPPFPKMKVVYHRALEALPWMKLAPDSEDRILWQKNETFRTPQEFYRASIPAEKVLAVNTEYAPPVMLDGYTPRQELRRYDVSLRGPQTIFFYSGGEEMQWKFVAQDMNRHDGADEIGMRILGGDGKIIFEEHFSDDGEVWGSSRPGKLREIVWKGILPVGAYKLELRASDDIFFRRMETAAQKFVFQYVIYLADASGFRASPLPVTLYGRANRLSLRTPHAEGVQTVNVEGESVSVAQANQSYQVETRQSSTEIMVPMPDLKIDFDGFFTFSPDAFFLPKAIGFLDLAHAERFGAEYVLAKDYRPFRDGDSIRSSAEISLQDIDQSGNLVAVMTRRGGSPDEWLIDDFRVTLTRESIDLSRLREMLSALLKSAIRRFSL